MCHCKLSPIIIDHLSLEPQSTNEASKVLEQGLVQNKFAVDKPRAMGLLIASVSCFY